MKRRTPPLETRAPGPDADGAPRIGQAAPLPRHAANALEKLKRIDGPLAEQYEKTRGERRKRSR